MSGVVESVAVAAALGAVKLLVKEVYKEVGKPWWESDKNAKVLHRLLEVIESAISDMGSQGATSQQLQWLHKVEPLLEEIKDAFDKHARSGILSKFGKSSKELMQKTERLRELCQIEVPAMTLQNSNEILRELMCMKECMAKHMAEVKEALELKHDETCLGSHQAREMGTCRHQDTNEPIGGNHDNIVKDVIEILLDDSRAFSKDHHECVGMWGLGGSGKTLAATRIFNDSTIQARFRGGCYWLTVGNAKRNIPNLLCELGKEMAPTHVAQLKNEGIKHGLFRHLKGRERMLLVLDDVWKIEALEILDVIPTSGHCKVLITTRNEDVLNSKHAAKLKMPMLCGEDSWKLFCHHAWHGDENIPSGLEEVGRQIACECGGLPLALKVIGGHLAGSNELSRWHRTLGKLKNAHVVSLSQDEQLYFKLQLSVDDLSNDTIHMRLRDCFFTFVAFPEDFEVELRRDLLPLWLGDGIVGNNLKDDPMEEAKELLDELVRRSLIERHIKYLEEEVFMVHDVLRDLIHHMLEKGSLVKRDCLYEAGVDQNDVLNELYSKVSNGSQVTILARCLSFMASNIKELPPKFPNAPMLKVMILQDNPIEAIPKRFFCDNFRDLRVLDLSRTEIRRLPKSMKNLKHLVVLNLCKSKVEMISYSFFKAVTNLQVLNVMDCDNLGHLPNSISLLTKLQYFYAMNSRLLEQDLWRRGEWYQWRRGSVTDLMKWACLKELHVMSKSQKALPDGIFKALKHLQILQLRFIRLVSIPEPRENELQHLQNLNLNSCSSLIFSQNSKFGVFLKNLRALRLAFCRNLQFLPEGLAGLPYLESLWIAGCQGLECLPDSFCNPGAFPVLKKLSMGGPSSKVRFPDLQAGAMPQLEELDLIGWKQLVDFPKSIANLTRLRILDLINCKNLRSLEQDGVGVQSLANLEELDVRDCQSLSTLPDGLEELQKLRCIKIRFTDITNFSQEVSHLVRKSKW